MARSFRREADGIQTAANRGPLQENPKSNDHSDEKWQLRRDAAGQIPLAKELETLGDVEANRTSASHSFPKAAKKRIRAKRDDQRGQAEPRDQKRVETSGGRSHAECAGNRYGHRQMGVVL